MNVAGVPEGRPETDRFVGSELGEYRIERIVGRGGMGVVYLATDDLDRMVALKLMLPELANNSDFRERFIRESQSIIEHPHVVTVYEAGEIDGVLYLAMEYIEGSDLKAVIVEEGRLLPARVVDLFAQAAQALDAAHEQALVHRDVKPQNILIKPPASKGGKEHVYLSDFGLVKRTASQSSFTHSAYLMGTIQYMSPEQIEGKTIDGRADVYGLGCVAYEALTGAVPFDKDSDVAAMWAHINDEPPRATDAVPVLPEAIDDVLARALAKDPDDRYLTCGEFVGELGQALGVSSGKRHKPVWSSGAVSASVQRPRPSGPTLTPPSRPEPSTRGIGGWIAAGMTLIVAIAAFTFSSRSPEGEVAIDDAAAGSDVQVQQTPGGAPSSEQPVDGAGGPGDEPQTRSERNRERRQAGGLGNAPRGGTRVPKPSETDRSAGEPSQLAPAPITAPLSGVYEYRQRGYEQQCPTSCSGGRNLPTTATVGVSRYASGADRVRAATAATLSDRWWSEITIDYFHDRAEIVQIDVRNSGATPAWRETIEPSAPIQWMKFPMRTGNEWSGEWTGDENTGNGATTGSYSIKVVKDPTLTIAGRSVRTFKLHAVVSFAGARPGEWDLFIWIDPETRSMVRISGAIKMDTYEVSLVATLASGPGY